RSGIPLAYLRTAPPEALEGSNMFSTRRGFSLIEIVVTLVAGSVLLGIAAPSVSGVRGHFAVSGARTTFSSLHARARAQAIERGGTVRLVVDAAHDHVAIWSGGRDSR
ncbi:MAG TPA: prepilin-type N-terminal cleavage/methylation domain-containing protein, partial [Longimicrobiales bacterium]|nr:prepilin-type N-terminal cleavage/methylation domain-containing protein [Longimicrobiales bacterium]